MQNSHVIITQLRELVVPPLAGDRGFSGTPTCTVGHGRYPFTMSASEEGVQAGQKRVAVVGGGLVGSLHAVLLSQRGHRVQLFEARPDIRKEVEVSGRSINLALSNRGREALRVVGIEDEVLAKAIPMPARMVHSLSGERYSVPYGTKGESIYSIDRRALNELLLTKAEEAPGVTLYFEHKLVRANLESKKLTFDVNGTESVFQTDFIFGCDGAHSTVRRQMMRWGRLNYQQEVIEHGYKELTLPATEDGEFAMEPNFLHIWPQHDFMMIGLPNPDKTFTLTLFMPFKIFESIETEEDLLAFFTKHFPNAIEKIGIRRLLQDYFQNPLGKTISVKCSPHYMAGSTLILGDAAHAVVPFYGQGMNAGFEDSLIFYELAAQTGNVLSAAAEAYQKNHWSDTQAICDLSMYNYLEMRSHVTSTLFLIRKKIDNILHRLFPRYFIPLYTMVAFTRLPYHHIVERNARQQILIRRGLWMFSLTSLGVLGYLAFKFSGFEASLRYRILPCVVRCVIQDYVEDLV